MNMAQMMISVFDRVRILWEKDKCLQNIFKILLQLYESPGLCGKGLKPFTPQILILMYQQQAAFENIVEKEKSLVTSDFSFSHNVFYSIR